MNHDFCAGCSVNSILPPCAFGLAPSNAYIETIINNTKLSESENFVCHKTAQEISNGKLTILAKCDDCGLCQILCPYYDVDYTTLFSKKLEKVIFNDLGKASILFQKLFSSSIVATEVQVIGNFRTKRIDLVIKKDFDIYLIKLLKTTDKVPFYMRSYGDVISLYSTDYSDMNFHALCLVPEAKTNDTVRIEANIMDISGLYSLLGGN